LSVAIALCGGSKFVVFDEPTAGMDLSARRQMWTMLKEYKRDRIILITTHYMDEADILGDRIGIMSAGLLSCLGSSMFLKRKFGVGYNLTMLKCDHEPNALVLPYFWYRLGPEVKKLTEVQSEITLQIPTKYASKFRAFFASFDEDLPRLEILAYGVQVTTLEDVFMKVGHLTDPAEVMDDDSSNDDKREKIYG
jgi:ATP-binding cassette, subfamily A (ABC1), member 3